MDERGTPADQGLLDWGREADLLAARVRAAEAELASVLPESTEGLVARRRLEMLARQLDVALRRWAEARFMVDAAPDSAVGQSLRRLTRAALRSQDPARSARRVPPPVRDSSPRW